MSPQEFGGWRSYFQRNPPDAAERLLSLAVRVQLSPMPGDDELRPWAYTAGQRGRMAEERKEARQREADEKLTGFMQ